MKITLIAVGTLKEAYLREGYLHFFNQISHRHEFHLTELPDEKTEQKNSVAQDRRILEKEGDQILKKIPPDAYVIALAIDGQQTDTPSFSKKMKRLQASGKNHIAFIIGGSLGLSPKILSRANWKLSFSPMTFPHQLMRIILMEQLNLVL